ncbi:MAG: acyl-CoA-binding protein [Deltaproteobacteria bacterium CG11_big_fil_rev_8_21_14_0_20_45_16]|nr:MAG: acyl-CoA-binding protein [Deltaproteobacteria bacterium CG11_big_fil_rev_8_21_14_0_20_45_16]
MSLDEDFNVASQKAFELPHQSNENLLKLYALYKQATEGDVRGNRPGFLDLKGRAKFDAWMKLRGMDQLEAKQDYVSLVVKLYKDAMGSSPFEETAS